ncbi:MAG: zinc ribbon domain-containing protein [Pseudomonadota bacterium]
MPIYEFDCRQCGKRSEVLIRQSEEKINCPACGSSELTRLLSTFSARGRDGEAHVHAGGGCSCCPSALTCPRSSGGF